MGVQRPARILVVAALAALLAGLLAGCAADPVIEPTPTPSFRSEAEAFAAAEATYRAYVDALNQVDLADPETFGAVYAWTTGDADADGRELFSQMHANGWTVSGRSLVSRTEWLGGNPDRPAIGVCLDVSAVQVFDAAGASVVSGDRPDLQSIKVEFVHTPDTEFALAVESLVGYEPVQPC